MLPFCLTRATSLWQGIEGCCRSREICLSGLIGVDARSLHNTWSRVSERQAQRLVKERKDGLSPDYLFLSKEDLIGPQPKGVIQTSAAWRELQGMVGSKQFKESINTLVGGVEKNYHRELAGKPPIEVSLNRIFIGSPGTGKMSVGRLYAAILAEPGLLSKNEVVLESPSDFVSAHLGESEKNTKAILRASEGKVLLIEAYGLFAGGGAGKGQANIYKAAVIDTIVGEVQSTPGDDRCVLLLGYEDQMKEMLDNSNPGLARRFPNDEGKERPKSTAGSQIHATVFNSWINVLFLLVPVGFALNYANVNAAAVFAINFVAIIPSTVMVSYAVEEISLRLGDLQGALLSITFSLVNPPLEAQANDNSQDLASGKHHLGFAAHDRLMLFFGGINRMEQAFSIDVAQTVSMMLPLAVVSLVVPTASRLMVSGVTDHDVVIQSRGTSIIILISYALYLFFQLRTHRRMFDAPAPKNTKIAKKLTHVVIPEKFRKPLHNTERGLVTHEEIEDAEEDPEEPSLSFTVAIVTLIISTILVAFNAEFATGSVQKMVHQAGISQTFVGFVIFPILSNDPESIVVAVKDKLDLSISLTLDKCMQVALLIVPLLVMIAWGMANEEMRLDFDGFPVAISFASVIVVAYVVQEGKSNWLMGALLIKVYVIVALATYFIH